MKPKYGPSYERMGNTIDGSNHSPLNNIELLPKNYINYKS